MKISKALEELKALEKLYGPEAELCILVNDFGKSTTIEAEEISGTGKQAVIKPKYQITWRDKQILDRMTSERIAKMFKDNTLKEEKQ